MSQKGMFLFQQYLCLSVVLISILGWGWVATSTFLKDSTKIPVPGKSILFATTGLGLVTLQFFFLAAASALTSAPILVILFAGVAFYVVRLSRFFIERRSSSDKTTVEGHAIFTASLFWVAIAVFMANVLLRPLMLPLGWDEVAYHLPTARAWAESGQLIVTDWLRYPLFPFNMQLLYAGALILSSDITAHLLHALTAFLAAGLVFSLARMYMPVVFSALASVFFLYASRNLLDRADIDLGLTLYVFSAFAALAFAYIEKQRALIYLAAFFVGMALGTKYQAMFFLPSLAICFLMVERSWKVLLVTVFIVIITGSYWYLRNFLVSGDPIHPIGGRVFGFWQWNSDDIRRQFMDFDGRHGLPPWYLLLSVGSYLFWKSSPPVVKACLVACTIAVVVWNILSGYARYLMPIYPMLAILSSNFLYRVFGTWNVARYWGLAGKNAQLAVSTVVLVLLVLVLGHSAVKEFNKLVLPGSPEQITLLREAYPGFDLLISLDQELFGAVYQLGFEDEIYYLGTPVLGDHFGKARYMDVLKHSGNSAELSKHLQGFRVVYLMVNLERLASFNHELIADPVFPQYFEFVGATPGAVLYERKDAEKPTSPRAMPFRDGAN